MSITGRFLLLVAVLAAGVALRLSEGICPFRPSNRSASGQRTVRPCATSSELVKIPLRTVFGKFLHLRRHQ
jgi:hypothetical protein